MSKQVFDTRELLEQIYDFGDVGRDAHRQKMEQIRDHVRLYFYDAAKELEASYYSSDYPQLRGGNPFVRYVRESYNVDDKLDYAKYFKRCRCCSRHSHYKMAAKPAKPVPESKQVDRCYCKCRHYSRIFQSRIFQCMILV
jgi:hypothetical protein